MTYFSDMSAPRRAWEAAGGAIVMGAVSGVLLGVNTWVYLAAIVVSVVGGIPAGGQHRTLKGALMRGSVAGALWAAALLVAHALSGAAAAVELPQPSAVLVVISVVVTAAVSAASWTVTAKRRSSVGAAAS